LKVNQQGPPRSIGFAESKIEQGQLYGEEYRDNQQLMRLSFLYSDGFHGKSQEPPKCKAGLGNPLILQRHQGHGIPKRHIFDEVASER
jgi:hypothetical protein